ncbi:MAG: hypothetical protein ACSHYF_05140 [Verrucomicrobiaceae bacterium]
MNYLASIGRTMAFRLGFAGILLHISLTAAAICLVIWLPFSIWGYLGDMRLPALLISEGKVIDAPLVNRFNERYDKRKSAYRCYLGFEDYAITHYRDQNPRKLEYLRIYKHPVLRNEPETPLRIVEVPENITEESVYYAATGRTLPTATAFLIGQILLTILTIYLAIKGYWLIKGKKGRRRH